MAACSTQKETTWHVEDILKGDLVCRHKRSQEAVERRHTKRRLRSLILASSFHDVQRCESVSLVSRVDILATAGAEVQISDVPDVVKGEVLVDSRGRGSFQIAPRGRGVGPV